jgi:acetylornithine deacetylase/succinyl-diaminopimelate desuccinylase-like protein
MRLVSLLTASLAVLASACATQSGATGGRATDAAAGEAEFRGLYKELIEINTTLSVGSCTKAAEAMKTRLLTAGYPASDLHIIADPKRPQDGNLVAILPGADTTKKPIMLLAHIDVVEANRADWERDPFVLTEEGGYFYARGAMDDKAMAAIFTDSMVRYKREGYRPDRTLKLVLTCGEESPNTFNGVKYLVENRRALIDAEFAVNEGAGGRIDPATGKYIFNGVQAGEKLYQDFTLEVTNPGGHSSRPVPDNAIYRLGAALAKVQSMDFPIEFNDATTGFFARMAELSPGQEGADMKAAASGEDAAAIRRLRQNPSYNAILHTTCIATQLNAGHAPNALPQRATANVNCRIFPGTTPEQVRQTLTEVINDPQVKVTMPESRSDPAPPPPLDPKVLGPAETLAAKMFPGVPQVRTMVAGGTDAAFTTPAGIPTYGISGYFIDADYNGIHGLNERASVAGLYRSRDYLYELLKIYGNQRD